MTKFKVGDIVLVNCSIKSLPKNTLAIIDSVDDIRRSEVTYNLRNIEKTKIYPFVFYDIELTKYNSVLVKKRLGLK